MEQSSNSITLGLIGMFISILGPIIMYLLGRFFDAKRYQRENQKLATESNKIQADSEVSRATVKKVESEAAQTLIQSASSLVEEYREMLDSLNKRYEKLDERLESTEKRLDEEIKKRRQGEKLTVELFRGFNEIIEQLHELDISPRWIPSEKMIQDLVKLEEESR